MSDESHYNEHCFFSSVTFVHSLILSNRLSLLRLANNTYFLCVLSVLDYAAGFVIPGLLIYHPWVHGTWELPDALCINRFFMSSQTNWFCFHFLVWIFVTFPCVPLVPQLPFPSLALYNSSIGPINAQLQLMLICFLLIWVIWLLWKKKRCITEFCLLVYFLNTAQPQTFNEFFGNLRRGEKWNRTFC